MSQITTLWTNSTGIDGAWVKRNYDQITQHPAWAKDMLESEASEFLEGKEAFTYILRSGGKEYAYFISFVQGDRSIKHQYFTLESDQKWHYKNAVITKPFEDIHKLIPQMMHCEAEECKALNART